MDSLLKSRTLKKYTNDFQDNGVCFSLKTIRESNSFVSPETYDLLMKSSIYTHLSIVRPTVPSLYSPMKTGSLSLTSVMSM